MAERKLDLARIAQTKPTPEAWGGKGDAPGVLDVEKVLIGSLDDSKDQLTSENSFPLSPQWLYSKNSESKIGNSAASGDVRPANSLSHGTSADSVQKDSWRLDGPSDKKDWRRIVPDVENSRRWRDEERETGSLGRRDRKKEGDRESDHRKNDRRSENVSVRDSSESRNPPSSDRWHEVSGRNIGLENRRDSKWSSRWGPEEKDSRAERKMDADKEDQFTEKQTFLNVRSSESDTRDKWRPRHRLEVHSSSSTVYRAAPGFGLDRGRIEASHVGFALGRGRGSLIGGFSQPRPSSAGPIGAAPLSRSYVEQGRSGLFVEMFRYPRGRLLDIYRKQKMLPDFEIASDGLEDAPHLTQSKPITPLAFVSPDTAEEALLEDMSKGKVTGSEVYHSSNKEWNARIDSSEIDMYSEVKKSAIISSMGYETSFPYPILSAADAATEDFVPAISGANSNTLFSDRIFFDGVTYEVSDHPVIDHQLEPKQHFGGKNIKDAECLQYLCNDSIIGAMSAAPFDVSIKLPDDSSSLFEIPFTEEIPINEGDNYENSEEKHTEVTSHEELSLFYQDPQGDIQGPFLGVDIISWFEQGFFGMDLPVCLTDAPEGTAFRPLGEVMPQLKLRPSSTTEVYLSELSGPLDIANDKFEVNDSLASRFGGSLDTADQRLRTAVSESMVGHEFQHRVLELSGYIEPPSGRTLVSELETSTNIPVSESHTLHDFVGQDAEEVLYTGRRMSDIEKPLEMIGDDDCDLSRTSLGHQFLASEIGQTLRTSHRNPSDNDINPLGLLWSELEGSHARHPISANMTGADDRIHNVNPSVLDSLLYAHKQEHFNSSSNHPFVHDAWPGASIQSNRSNKIQDGMDADRFPNFEAEFNHLGLQDQLPPHQFQRQQLQKHLPSHQNMHLGEPFALSEQGSVHHIGSNQSMLDFEHLYKLQLQEEHHLQRLLEQQQLQQQQQQLQQHQQQLQQQQQQRLYHQMHLLKRQQQEQEQQMLFEHLLQRQVHDPSFAASHVDPLRNTSLDQILLRQHLLRDLEHQPHHLQRNQDLVLEQLLQAKLGHNLHHEHHNDLLDVLSHQKHRSSLSMEEQILLSLQQEQLQARQFPVASRQKRGMEEDRHVGGVWSVDESGQFVRTPASTHQPHLNRLNQADFIQSLQQPSPFEQASLLEQNLMLHERMQQSPYERNTHPFDSSILMSHSPPESNADVLNAIARLQGLDMPEIHAQMHPSIQARQFHPVNSSHEHHISNQLLRPRLNVMESQWPESNGPNNLVEAQLSQFHFESERQKRDMRESLYNMELNRWTGLARNENSKHGIDEFFQQQLVLQPSQPSELIDTAAPSFEDRDSSWFPHSSLDNSFNRTAENAALRHSFTEGSNLKKVFVHQDGMVNANVENEAGNYDICGNLALRSRSNLSIEHNQFFPEVDEIEKEQAADPVFNDSSGDRVDFSDFKDVKRLKKRGSKGKALSSIDQASGSLSDHREVKVNAPIRNASLGSNAGGLNFYNYETGTDNVYSEGMTNSRSLRILDRGTDSSSLKHAHDPLILTTHSSLSELVSAPPIEGKLASGFLSSDASTSGILKDMRFRRTSSEVDAPEASFIDIIKSSKKPTESEAHSSAHDLSESGHGAKSGKKKGKKGRQIDPSLLGFKVHSNRIMMGEIQRPDD